MFIIKISLLILLTLLTKIAFAQKLDTHIPDNGKIVTVHKWFIAEPMPSKYYPSGKNQLGAKDGFLNDFLISIGGESSPTIVSNKKFKTPDGDSSNFFPHVWQNDYIDLTDLFGRPTNQFTCLFTKLKSDINQDVYLHIGTNDAGKVWINGELFIQHLNG